MAKKVDYVALDGKVLAVAVEGEVQDWAAYIGAVPGQNFDREYDEVARHGSKLPQSIAEILFPSFRKFRWRP